MTYSPSIFSTVVICLLLLLAGCNSRTAAVDGRVKFKDNSDVSVLAGYGVSFESEESKTSAAGEISADGTFTVSTYGASDGALPGKHKVAISPPLSPDPDKPPQKSKLPAKYEDFNTSGLTVEIKPGRNAVELELEPAK